MLHTNIDMKQWKQEQILYFKRYLNSFKHNSKEYSILRNGIDELEKSL